MSSQIQMDVGEIQMQSNSSISYYITSLVEGNIELVQKIWYQTENSQGPIVSPTESNSSSIENSPVHALSTVAAKKNQQRQTHNIQIEYNNDGVRKTKEDVTIIPCVAEFKFTGKFYTLSKQALTKAYKNEDFLFRFDAEIKSPCDIDILDMFLVCVSFQTYQIQYIFRHRNHHHFIMPSGSQHIATRIRQAGKTFGKIFKRPKYS